MASRRRFKKIINNSFEGLYRDCIFYKAFVKDSDKEAADLLIRELTGAQNELLSRVSASEGKELKGRTRNYYKNLKNNLKTQIDNLGLRIQKLH